MNGDPDREPDPKPVDRLWLNESRTVMVRIWPDGKTMEVATRRDPSYTWGPPVTLHPADR